MDLDCENSSIWKSYQILKQHFPDISAHKEKFFQQLSMLLSDSDPEIQSCDGLYIDVLWENLTLIIADDMYSISHKEEFQYFETSSDALDYVTKNVLKV